VVGGGRRRAAVGGAHNGFESDERKAERVGSVGRAAGEDAGALAAEPRRLHLRLDHLVTPVLVEEEDQPHVREALEAVERVGGGPCSSKARARARRSGQPWLPWRAVPRDKARLDVAYGRERHAATARAPCTRPGGMAAPSSRAASGAVFSARQANQAVVVTVTPSSRRAGI
jgi:hypothetical protein